MRISKTFTFDAAHHLPGYKGKCSNVHGHTWKVEVVFWGKKNKDTGMVKDFNEIKDEWSILGYDLDHSYLNNIIKNPTAENIAEYIFKFFKMFSKEPEIVEVNVWESPTSMVSYDRTDYDWRRPN